MSDPTGATNGSQYVPGFRANLMLAPQQTTSRLLPYVDNDLGYTEKGTFFNADDVGTSDPSPVTTRVPDSPDGFVDMVRRFGVFQPYNDGKFLDNEDLARELADPTSETMRAIMAGQGRYRDQSIIAGAFGAYQTQSAPGIYTTGPTLAALTNPATGVAGYNIIPHNYGVAHESETLVVKPATDGGAGGGGYGLTVGKLAAAKTFLDNSEIDEPMAGQKPDNYTFACTSAQLLDLLLTIPASSTFYVQVQALINGTLDYFMGFRFVRLPGSAKYSPLPKTGYTRKCLAFHKRAIMYRARPIINARVTQREDKSFRWYAYYEADHGAVRRYDNGVVEVDCDESTASIIAS